LYEFLNVWGENVAKKMSVSNFK